MPLEGPGVHILLDVGFFEDLWISACKLILGFLVFDDLCVNGFKLILRLGLAGYVHMGQHAPTLTTAVQRICVENIT